MTERLKLNRNWRINMRTIVVMCAIFAIGIGAALYGQQEKKPAQAAKAEVIADEQVEKHLAAFEKDGVPTHSGVEAAIAKAQEDNTIESWAAAAKMANEYSNVISVLDEHYKKKYEEEANLADSQNDRLKLKIAYLESSGAYNMTHNECKKIRNQSYLNIAELFLEKGDRASALSFAMTAVELSGGTVPIERGEALIKKIVEYKEQPEK